MKETKRTFLCAHCGKEESLENGYMVGDDCLCPTCADELTCLCEHCGKRIYYRDNAGDDGTIFCSNCESHFLTCEDCGCYIHESQAYYESEDDDIPYCAACIRSVNQTRFIHDYSYKPYPVFYGEHTRYFGVELEIDSGGEYSENAEKILNVANVPFEHVYIKRDGSIENGMEIVSHPCSLEYHETALPWSDILEKALSLGYLSHRTSTCGLHVHVNRETFGETIEDQDLSIARLLFFVEKHWCNLLRFSRRTPAALERWASRYGYHEQPQEVLKCAKKGCVGDRYRAINLSNTPTIEFRLFRGSLKLNTLIATLQLLSDDEIKELSWKGFVARCTKPELIQYLKERNLYEEVA